MRPLTPDIVQMYKSKDFIANSPSVYVTIDNVEFINVKSININREEDVIAKTFTINLSNVYHSDWTDVGYYNANRNDAIHNKPQNSYYGVITQGKEVVISVEYGSNSNVIFTGIIDTVKAVINDSPEIQITGRDIGKYLIESEIWCEDTTSGSEILDYITYPIDPNITSVYLTDTDTNPYLYEIFIDACRRSGIALADIDVGDDPTVDFPLKLEADSVNQDFFDELSGTWQNLVDYIKKLLVANIDVDEAGIIKLSKKIVPDPDAYKGITLSGTAWSYIGINNFYKDRAVESSLIVYNSTKTATYTKDFDWEYDETTNSIRRIATGVIADGESVWVYEKYVNWIFKNGQDIFDLTQWTSSDDKYGKIVATNDEEDLRVSYTMPSYGDGSTINPNKILKVDLPEILTETALENWVMDKAEEMRRNYFQVETQVLPITQLQIGDTVQFLVYGTIAGIYVIRNIDWSWSADSAHSCVIKGTFLANP